MYDSVSYKFGIVGMLAGSVGVPLGSAIAQRLRPTVHDCDPLICGFALLASAPLIYFALIAVDTFTGLSYFLIFCGMVTLNLTWSIVADMILVSVFWLYKAEISLAKFDLNEPCLAGIINYWKNQIGTGKINYQ